MFIICCNNIINIKKLKKNHKEYQKLSNKIGNEYIIHRENFGTIIQQLLLISCRLKVMKNIYSAHVSK